MIKNIVKNFSTTYESEQGVFSIDSLKTVVKEAYQAKSVLEQHRYPKDVALAKAFLYALTSDKNKYEVLSQYFIKSCNRFGLDCPFPFVKLFDRSSVPAAVLDNSQLQQQVNSSSDNRSQTSANKLNTSTKQDQVVEQPKPHLSAVKMLPDSQSAASPKDTQTQKFDGVSSLFAQHYSLLRELRSHCLKFKDMYDQQLESTELYSQFGNIVSILETGCQFLNFPINL